MRLDRFMVLLTLTASLFNSIQFPVLGQSQEIDDGEAIPAGIVLRLLSSDYQEANQIFLNQLPNDLPIQLPLPDQATILASIIYRVGEYETYAYRVLLDVPQEPDVVAAQYKQQLESLGWELPSPPEVEQGGFIPSAPELNRQFAFCNADETYVIFVTLSSQEGNSTGLNLDLTSLPDNGSFCGSTPDSSEPLAPGVPMPSLNHPPEAIVNSIGSSATGTQPDEYSFVVVNAQIESDLSAEAIAQHYAAQWEAAGWTLQSEETNGSVNTIWIFEDEAGQLWQGTLTINPTERSRRYSATATVETLQEN